MFAENVDPSRDLKRERKLEIAGEAAFVLKQYDPHGFWRIHREHGQVPAHLQGDYTTVKAATEAVEAYTRSQKPKTKAAH